VSRSLGSNDSETDAGCLTHPAADVNRDHGRKVKERNKLAVPVEWWEMSVAAFRLQEVELSVTGEHAPHVDADDVSILGAEAARLRIRLGLLIR
jgi:hypothetical protein